MGLIKTVARSLGSILADQWREYFYCDSMKENVLVMKGQKKNTGNSSNIHGSDNIISDGSIISVADGQCVLVVEQGKVVELCAEAGVFVYDTSSEPTIFYGNLSKNIWEVFKNSGRRITFGGEAPDDQRVYYFNTKELTGNKYGTANPVPFRVVDENIGLDIDIAITCFGEFSYRITNPLLFYTNICGNVESAYLRETIDGQLESELLTALQPAFAKISNMGLRYSALPGHTEEIAKALNEILSEKWKNSRGIEMVSFGMSGVRAKQEDEQMIKELQRNAVFRNPTMAAAQLVGAQSAAMQSAASNENTGAAMAFMGMNMASAAGGIRAEDLFKMEQNNSSSSENRIEELESWNCSCGAVVKGNFCSECGAKKPDNVMENQWTCTCGSVNNGNFCSICGKKRISAVSGIKCGNCGWESDLSGNTIKFCPNCGNPFQNQENQSGGNS